MNLPLACSSASWLEMLLALSLRDASTGAGCDFIETGLPPLADGVRGLGGHMGLVFSRSESELDASFVVMQSVLLWTSDSSRNFFTHSIPPLGPMVRWWPDSPCSKNPRCKNMATVAISRNVLLINRFFDFQICSI